MMLTAFALKQDKVETVPAGEHRTGFENLRSITGRYFRTFSLHGTDETEEQQKGIIGFMKKEMLYLKDSAAKMGIELSDLQLEQFDTYYEMLVEKNKVMNLTAITDLEEVVQKHFLDSISLIKVEKLNQDISIIDLGTGAGFPGIPLKIAFPELEICLADSLNKRVLFLNEVIEELELKKISAVHGRAEELARQKGYREQFDLCVSRAVANLSTLSEYCLPFVKVGGKFISYKANEVEEETKQAEHALEVLGGACVDIQKFQLPDSEMNRAFVIIEKKKKTPAIYPRKAGTPSKKPL